MPGAWLTPLLHDEAAAALRDEGGGVRSALPGGAPSAGRFEGLYGGVYDRVIQSDAIRGLAPLAYGDPGPVGDLDGFVARVADAQPGVLLDVPCGGGTLLPRLAGAGFGGRVVEADLGHAMLRRAARLADAVPLDVALLRADALDLPLRDGAVDGAVSLNGLHCMPDAGRFLDELGRVLRPGGRLWLVTLVAGGTRRADAAIRAGRATGILPATPPPRAGLERLLARAGFADPEFLGGAGLLGYAATRA